MTTSKPWVSVEGVAKHLGLARNSVCHWIERRGLPSHRIGRVWRFKRSQVDTFVDAGGAASNDVEGGAR